MQLKNIENGTVDAAVTILRGLIRSKPMTAHRKSELTALIHQLASRHPGYACPICGKVSNSQVPRTTRRQMAYNDILKEIESMQVISDEIIA